MKENVVKIAIIGGQSGQALNRAAKKRGLYTMLFCGTNTDSGFGEADENYEIDLSKSEKITTLIKEKADMLLLGTGHELAHNIAKTLYDCKFPVSINPYSAEYGKDKSKAYAYIKDRGYNCPPYIIVKDKKEWEETNDKSQIPPCVVKSKNDKVRTAKANDYNELLVLMEEHIKNKSEAIIEKFINGIEYTIPVVSDGKEYSVLDKALDMEDINKIAIGHLRNFTTMDNNYDRKEMMADEALRREICDSALDIAKSMGLVGFVRFDLIVTPNKKIYWLEVNEVSVSALGDGHYPWESVDIYPAEIMVDNMLNMYENECKKKFLQ